MVNSKKSVRGIEKPRTKKRLKMSESSGNVFKDIGFGDALADSLFIRGSLMIEIEKIIKSKGWTQAEAAHVLGVTQPRISEIMSDRTDLFGIDTLVNYLSILGKKVTVVVKDVDAA
jgi:predicted XRE-type DNA-binding protein